VWRLAASRHLLDQAAFGEITATAGKAATEAALAKHGGRVNGAMRDMGISKWLWHRSRERQVQSVDKGSGHWPLPSGAERDRVESSQDLGESPREREVDQLSLRERSAVGGVRVRVPSDLDG